MTMNEFTIVQKIAVYAIPVLFAIIVHEVAHGVVAYRFGDQTARLAGRLTLNPLPHIDLVGTIILPALCLAMGGFIFGWARPVPVDARNMRHPRADMVLVSAAGPIANFLMALGWAGVVRLSPSMSEWFATPIFLMGSVGIEINLWLGILNLLPIPPLDGGRVLCNLLPPRLGWQLNRLEPYGFLILILLMATNVLAVIISPLYMLLRYGVWAVTGV